MPTVILDMLRIAIDTSCTFLDMTAMDESQALTTAIGEYSLSNLGKENLSGLQVIFNPREATAFVTIALRDRSTEAQRSAIETMYDVADVYDDEATLEFVFVEHISDTIEANSMVPQYSYA